MHRKVLAVFALLCPALMLACSFLEPTKAASRTTDTGAAAASAPQSPLDDLVLKSADAAGTVGNVAGAAARLPLPPVNNVAALTEAFSRGYESGLKQAAAGSSQHSRNWLESIGLIAAGLAGGMGGVLGLRKQSPQ